MEASEMNLADGEYTVEVTMEGGSGRASIQSPTELTIENGQAQAEIVWSSSHYDYMMVNGDKYLPVNTEGNSTFEIPVSVFDEPMTVIGLPQSLLHRYRAAVETAWAEQVLRLYWRLWWQLYHP